MQLEVIQRKENPLLKRTEVRFKAIHKAEATPTRDVLRAFLAKELNATKDIVVIDSQASTFGRYETVGYAKVYKTKEEALAVERKHILVRNKLIEPEVKKEAAPKPEKPAPTPRAQKPAEAPKAEAPKPEAKPEAKAEAKGEKATPKEEKKPAAKEDKKPPEKREEKKDEKKAEPKKKGGK
jgi:small subunit ribosomal protein S24e